MRKPSYGRPRTMAPLHSLSRALPPLAIPRLSPARPPKRSQAAARPPKANRTTSKPQKRSR